MELIRSFVHSKCAYVFLLFFRQDNYDVTVLEIHQGEREKQVGASLSTSLILVGVGSSDHVVFTWSSATSRNLRTGDGGKEGAEEGREDDMSAPDHFLRGWPR